MSQLAGREAQGTDGVVTVSVVCAVTGERITIYLAEDRNVVEGGKQERVKAVFYPKNQQEAAKPDAKPAGDGKPAGGAPCS